MGEPLPIERLRPGLHAWGFGDADVVEIKPGVTADVFLVLRGDQRWVAKYNYDYRDHFEVGLRTSRVVARRLASDSFKVAEPLETRSGALTEMVEWPDGQHHPLAVLAYAPGDPIPVGAPDAAAVLGEVCGRVHAALLDVAPDDVGMAALPDRPDGDYPDRDAGPHGWLHTLWRQLEQSAWDERHRVRHAISVWDGPEVRRWPGGLSVLDFGHTGWHAVVHVVANRSLNVALADESQLPTFLAAVEAHLPTTPAERELFQLHRLRNAAIYARWVAMEKVARREPNFNDRWFQELLAMLERELPRIGMQPPAVRA